MRAGSSGAVTCSTSWTNLATGPDYVVVANRLIGRGSSSGAPVDLRWASVFWFRGRQVARTAGYNTRRAAFEAVGLSD